MKTSLNSILFLFLFVSSSNVFACHEGDFESKGKGHHKWGKKVGIFQFTENITISSATLTSCDYYTAFLDSQYYIIQEQVVYGRGPHIDALSMINGCTEKFRTEFSKTLRTNYIELFSDRKDPKELRIGIEKLIDSNYSLRRSCRRI